MRKITKITSLVMFVLVTAIALCACAGDKDDTASLKDSITIGIAQDLEDGLDPHYVTAAGTKEILFNIYEGLVKYDSDGNLIPAVASDYVISDNGLTYTFTLRDGIKFHDGSAVTTQDVKYSIERCTGTDGGTPLVAAFSNIKDITVDDTTITINLESADSDFLAYMTNAIIPQSNSDPSVNVIGTGPYMFVSRSPQESITLKAFDEYWGEKAHIANVNLKICSNADSLVMDMMGGSVDVFFRVTTDQANQLENNGFEILEGTMNLVQALYLNNDFEPFNDVRVRQALCYAVDQSQIMELLSEGKGTEIGSSMFPAFGKYYDEALNDVYNPDIEKARQLLEEAGYPDGFSFTITVPSNYQQHVDTATILVEQLKEIGVTAEIQLVDWDTWLSDTYVGRNFEATVIGVDASVLTARALLERFVSDNDSNFVNFCSEAYDEAFYNAISTNDDALQTGYFKDCLTILSEEAANVYIQDLPVFVAVREGIGGYEFYPLYVQNLAALYYE